ncbi:hypothetical protein D1624_22115, partial [Klebsiella pneumoniae]
MLKKTALSCAASPFAAVPQRDCHQPLLSQPRDLNSACQPYPFPSALPNPTQTYLKFFSPRSHLHPYHNPSLLKQMPNILSPTI